MPHVIEPSAGADRATLAFLCEAYHEDEVPDENGKPTKRVVHEVPPPAGPDQGGGLPAGQEGRHARDRPGNLRAAQAALERLLRREGGGGPALSPPGRGRHAVLHHRRRPDALTTARSRSATATRSGNGGSTRTSAWPNSAGGWGDEGVTG